jgi:hypothetical protein
VREPLKVRQRLKRADRSIGRDSYVAWFAAILHG